MAVTDEMVAFALRVKPDDACLVPERREELTTEGGLDVVSHRRRVERVTRALAAAGVRVNLFVDPKWEQLEASREAGAAGVELHTGDYANATVAGRAGWEGLHVWWLVDRAQTGATGVVFNVTQFPSGKTHELHRHPHAEEALYVLKGSGLHLSEGEPVRQNEGDVIYIPRGEWHGFTNDTDGPITVIAVFGGVGSYDEAGYEDYADVSGA